MIRFRMKWQDAPGVRDTVLARSSYLVLLRDRGGRAFSRTEAALMSAPADRNMSHRLLAPART